MKNSLSGDFDEITKEVRAIQGKMQQVKPPMSPDHLAKTFAKLIFQGKINAALKLLDKNESLVGCVTHN